MTEEAHNPGAPMDVLVAKGPEFALGFDTQRTWATGVQPFINHDFSMLVFREQISANPDDGSAPAILMRNVASVVIPTEVMREFHKIVGGMLEALDGNQ